MTVRYDDQLFARCSKADRRKAERIAKKLKMKVSDYVRTAVQEANTRYEEDAK